MEILNAKTTSTAPSRTASARSVHAAEPSAATTTTSRDEFLGLLELSVPQPLHKQFDPKMILNRGGERAGMIQLTREGSLTAASAEFGQLGELHRKIDFTSTKIGSAALLRDILHPPNNLAGVEERRAAIRELQQNPEIRVWVETALQATQSKFLRGMSIEECALLTLASDVADDSRAKLGFIDSIPDRLLKLLNPNRDMPARLKAFGKLLRTMDQCPTPESPLLRTALGTIKEALASPDRELLDGKAVIRMKSIDSRQKTPWYVPSFRMNGSLLNLEERPGLALLAVTGIKLAAGMATAGADYIINLATQPLLLVASGMMLVRSFFVNDKAQLRLQERVKEAPKLLEAVDALGRIDALLSLSKLESKLGVHGCLPTLREGAQYSASYIGMKNPSLAMATDCVANDLTIGMGKVFILTGPNSGGKSTIATALIQNQILAQLGAPVVAAEASLTIADQILYQGPTFKALGKHGKFGTELEATRDLFNRTTSRSLVVLDEVGDGTTAKEGLRQAYATLWGFNKLRVGTVLVTHNTKLANALVRKNIGDPYQLENIGGEPTFRLIPSISRHSNADRVAKILQFSPDDIRNEVRKRTESLNNKNIIGTGLLLLQPLYFM